MNTINFHQKKLLFFCLAAEINVGFVTYSKILLFAVFSILSLSSFGQIGVAYDLKKPANSRTGRWPPKNPGKILKKIKKSTPLHPEHGHPLQLLLQRQRKAQPGHRPGQSAEQG